MDEFMEARAEVKTPIKQCIALSDGMEIEILSINFSTGTVDWKRIGKGYSGACVTPVFIESIETAEKSIISALESELIMEKERG